MITTASEFFEKRHGLGAGPALHIESRWRRLIVSLAISLALAAGVLGGTAAAVAAEDATPSSTVNINSADAATLATVLKGIGTARATEIVRHRQMYGDFSTAEELMEVKGIGRSTLDLNRKVITLE